MYRPKLQHSLRPQHRKYEQLTPKIPAKTPPNYRQRKLAGQSSALPANRSRQKYIKPLKMEHPTYRLESLNRQKTPLTQQMIKQSTIYKLLEQQIMNLSKRHDVEMSKMHQLKLSKQQQHKQIKTEQHSIKLQIWQLRNQTMQLKQSLKQQHEQTQKLMDQLGLTQQDIQNMSYQPESQGNYENESIIQNEQDQRVGQ